ncbi:5-methylcytosine-specific restriction protein A [Kitasatospora herbaricolor]|uniref:HNH endonuclease n=1 Tax=Kitasatospora herbaricolor TaxID=68217 RepID=UPI00174B073B|nr:HNH endonuclease [Kitasatospora herbaricolor]MDQ0309275.1 5-methylcytosine-specific restriction protein A [Kitasatospora herbaricolor]
MEKGAISRDDILRTLHEYDELGGPVFLNRYGYGAARKYLILHDGKAYESKAVAGVAHKHRFGRPLGSDELSGGLGHAVDWLKREGFQIGASRSPKWTRDELILACDVVARNGWQGLSASDPRIAELSDLLQLLAAYPPELRAVEYRNRNGAAYKTLNIASVHPAYTGDPTNHGQLDREVLQAFLDRPAEMAQAAQLLRDGLRDGTLQPVRPDDEDADDDEVSAPEGRVLYRRHRTRERSKKLREKKIASVLKKGDPLACEACDFDFAQVYGERGKGYIEVHHVVPLHEAGESTTKLTDLAVICSNCHRMIHRSAPWPTPAQLRVLVLVQEQAGAAETSLPRQRSGVEHSDETI